MTIHNNSTKQNKKRMMFLFYVLLFSLAIIGCSNIKEEQPLAQKGVLDLRDWNFAEKDNIALLGEWNFFWQEFKNPKDFSTLNNFSKADYLKVPSAWNSSNGTIRAANGKGYATYHLRILLPAGSANQTMSLMLRHVLTSYKLYVNGELLSEVGKAGKTQDRSRPAYLHQVQSFIPQSDVVDIVLHVSNFFYRKGGLLEPFLIGTEATINFAKFSALSYDLFLLGALIIMSLYHFGLFLLRKKTIAFLFFGIFTFVFSFRVLTRGQMFINSLYPDISFAWQIRLEYLSFFLSIPIFFWFLYSIFPKYYNLLFGKIVTFVTICLALFILVTPPIVFTHILGYIQIIALFNIVGILIFAIWAAFKNEEGSRFLLFSLLILAFTAINDLLHFSGVIQSMELARFGIFFLVFSQAFILSHRVATAFANVEKVSLELEQLTLANSRFVPEPILNFLDKKSILEIELGNHTQKRMGILFLGIDNFYEIIDKKSSKNQLQFINSYLGHMGPIVRNYGGFIDKYSESGFMAVFPNTADELIEAVIHIQQQITIFKETHNYQQTEIKVGVGAHIGDLMLGTVGEEKRIDATVISDAVNVSARLKDLTKSFSANFLLSEQLKFQLKNSYAFRKLGTIPVRGKAEPIRIYELLNCYDNDILQNRLATCDIFEQAIDFLEQKKFKKAHELFSQVMEKDKTDEVVQYYLQVLDFNFEEDA